MKRPSVRFTFGAGLIIASVLFGLWHVENTYDPAIGFPSLDWGWGLTSGVAGLVFGAIRAKTGALPASSITHGLPDPVGEALNEVFG